MRTKLLLVDENREARVRLCRLLARHPELGVDCEAASDEEALRLALERRPDVGLVEIDQERVDGIRLIRRLEARGCPTRWLVCSERGELDLAMMALDAGACGYVNKSATADEIYEAVDAVRNGELFLSHSLAIELAGLSRDFGAGFLFPSLLSPAERAVYERMREGDSLAQIVDRLGLPSETVERRRERLMEKLDLSGFVDLCPGALRDTIH